MKVLSWTLQVIATILILGIPVLWPEQIALMKISPYVAYSAGGSWHPNWTLVGFVASGALLILGQWTEKRTAAREQKAVSDDRVLMEAYAAAVKDSIQSAAVAHAMGSADRVTAQRKILSAAANVVSLYYGREPGLEINACQMLAYPVSKAPPDAIDRARKFVEGGRHIEDYEYILDLDVWAKDCEPKHLSLPVENTSDQNMQLKLLPGAPAAFALRTVQIVSSTDDIASYFNEPSGLGRNLDGVAKEAQLAFFRKQAFKSFVSIPIEMDDTVLGVLNVQSNKLHILGPKNKYKDPVTNLLEPFRHALAYIEATTPPVTASKG